MFSDNYDRNRDELEDIRSLDPNTPIDKGPGLCMDIFTMYKRGFKYRQIAKAWGMPVGTVASKLSRKGVTKRTHKRGGNLNE